MKYRKDFVTNSSSSSFIITNNTDEPITGREVAEYLFERIMNDAEDVGWLINPGESVEYECADDYDNMFETFIHNTFGGWNGNMYDQSKVKIEFGESHH